MRLVTILAACAALSACGDQAKEPAEPAAQFERASADLVVHGRRLADVLGCTGCHAADLTGEDWSEPGFGRMWTANLTRSAQRFNDAQLAEIIRRGARPDGSELWEMPSHLFTHLNAEEMAAIIAFIRSMPPKGAAHPAPVFEEGARREMAAGTFKSSPAHVKAEGAAWPPDAGEPFALGRYIVRATCAECHRMDLRGGQPYPKAVPRPDLRMVAAYPAEDFKRLLRTGIATGNREVSLMSQVARSRYKHLTDAEIAALHAYLQKVAEVAP